MICHTNSSCVATKLYMCMQQLYGHSARPIFTFPTVDVCRARSPGSGQAFVTHAKVARLQHFLIHYLSCLKFCFCFNYRAKYYYYILQWCSGVACNWCVSLDILNCCFTMQYQIITSVLNNFILFQPEEDEGEGLEGPFDERALQH